MKNVEIKLRAHHGGALLSLRERATAPALLPTWRGFWNIWSRKTQPLQLLRRRTAFAAAAPTLQTAFGESADLVQSYDRQVLSLCDMEEHSVLPWREFAARVAEYILSQGKRSEICGGCQWSSICKEKEALYRL